MTPERAKEILQLGSRWCNWEKHVTPDENKFVRNIWDHMPGYTCWHDALCRVAKGPEHYRIVWYNGCIRGIVVEEKGNEYGIRLENGNFVWASKDKIEWR